MSAAANEKPLALLRIEVVAARTTLCKSKIYERMKITKAIQAAIENGGMLMRDRKGVWYSNGGVSCPNWVVDRLVKRGLAVFNGLTEATLTDKALSAPPAAHGFPLSFKIRGTTTTVWVESQIEEWIQYQMEGWPMRPIMMLPPEAVSADDIIQG